MKLHLTFYGVLKQEVGARELILTLPQELISVRELSQHLIARYPTLEGRMSSVAVALNDELVRADHPLRDGDRASLLPPVSGG